MLFTKIGNAINYVHFTLTDILHRNESGMRESCSILPNICKAQCKEIICKWRPSPQIKNMTAHCQYIPRQKDFYYYVYPNLTQHSRWHSGLFTQVEKSINVRENRLTRLVQPKQIKWAHFKIHGKWTLPKSIYVHFAHSWTRMIAIPGDSFDILSEAIGPRNRKLAVLP